MVILLAEYKIKDFKNNQIKMTRTIVVILALISLGNISCKKDTQALPQNKNVTKKETSSMYSALFGGSLFYDGLIQYRADCESRRDTAGNIHQSVYYLGTGNFYDNLVTQGLNVGNVSWGGIILTPDSARYGRWTYQFDNSHYSNPINNTQFGSNTDFSIAGGSAYANSIISMYVPDEIYLDPEPWSCSSPVIYNSKLPKTIYWNSDPNNQTGVVIVIEYNGFRSNLKNATYSDASFFNPPIYVPDNGHFDINSSVLVNMPLGSIITVHLGRANQEDIIDANGKVVVVTAIAETKVDYNYET
jgi:hypothetical protein